MAHYNRLNILKEFSWNIGFKNRKTNVVFSQKSNLKKNISKFYQYYREIWKFTKKLISPNQIFFEILISPKCNRNNWDEFLDVLAIKTAIIVYCILTV